MRIIVIFLSLIFGSIIAFSQELKVDNIQRILKKGNISEKEALELRYEIRKYYLSKNQSEETVEFFLKMKDLAIKLNDKNKETTAYLHLAEFFMNSQNFEDSKKYASMAVEVNKDYIKGFELGINSLGRVYHHFQKYEEAINTYQKGIRNYYAKKPDHTITPTLYINMGISYDRLGKDEAEMKCYLKGLEIADSLQDKQAQNFAIHTIAGEYMDLGNYEKAEEYYLKGLKNAEHNRIEVYTSMNYRSLGILYSRWKKFDLSLKYNRLALVTFQESGQKLYEFDVLNNIAVLYFRMDSLLKSIKYGNRALTLAKELKHQLAITGVQHTVGNSYLELGNLKKAEYYFSQVLPYLDNPDVLRLDSKISFLENMSNLRRKQGRFEDALDYYKKFKIASDTLVQRQRFDQVNELEMKFQSEKKEKELQKKESTILSQKLEIKERSAKNSRLAFQRTRLTFILTFTFAALLILGVFFLRRGKLIKLERERTRQVVIKIDQLKSDLERKTKELKGNFAEKLTNFHEMLRGRYGISETIFEYWLLQVEGLSEEQMQERLHLSPAAIKSRRSKLYSALKSIEDIEQKTSLQRFRSVGIYYENMLKHFM